MHAFCILRAHMAARAMWKGALRLGKVTVGVKLYAAVEDRDVHFHLVHRDDEVRVVQRMVNPTTGESVEGDAIQKGYAVSADELVVLTDEELRSVQPAPSRDIEVLAFVPAEVIAPAYYDRPYFLGPDGPTPDYFALAHVLSESGQVGIARWALRGRTYDGALRAEGEHLVLVTLRPHAEVIQAPAVPAGTRELDQRELTMAEQLVAALESRFDPGAFHDEHRERVLALVQAKAKGQRPQLRAIPGKRATTSLSAALEKSLANVRKGGDVKDTRKEKKSA